LRDGTTDITGKTQSVLVGLRIGLTAQLPPGATLAAGAPWSLALFDKQRQEYTPIAPDGSTIGAFVITLPSPRPVPFSRPGLSPRISTGKVIQTDFTQASTTFYWVVPGTYQVTLSCTLSNGQSASAQATFEVDGPRSAAIKTYQGQVAILDQTGTITSFSQPSNQAFLSFGNPNTVPE
jgi:hypothetical protein